MRSNIKIQIFAVLLISSLNLHSTWGQRDKFQLKLGEIDTNEVQLKASGDDEYVLRVSQPNGQVVEKIALERSDSKDPVITKSGNIMVNYPNENLNLVLNYEADSNGYRASYRIGNRQSGELPLDFNVRLNIKDLKSLAG